MICDLHVALAAAVAEAKFLHRCRRGRADRARALASSAAIEAINSAGARPWRMSWAIALNVGPGMHEKMFQTRA